LNNINLFWKRILRLLEEEEEEEEEKNPKLRTNMSYNILQINKYIFF
jgi:hypothetical protein